MNILSKALPKVIFLLEGEGEYNWDIWQQYWLNGTYQEIKADITFDDMNLNSFQKFSS